MAAERTAPPSRGGVREVTPALLRYRVMAYVVGVLMGNRDVVRRLAAHSGAGLATAA